MKLEQKPDHRRCNICYEKTEKLYYNDDAYYCPDCEDNHAGWLCWECYNDQFGEID